MPDEDEKGLNEALAGFSSPWSCQSRMTDTLLLIDDNAVQAATRQTILKRAGYFVIAALNPAPRAGAVQDGRVS